MQKIKPRLKFVLNVEGENKMGVSRNLLHKNKLADFREWLEKQEGVKIEEGKGDYQVMRIRDDRGLHILYAKLYPTDHISVPQGALRWIRRYLKFKKRNQE